jgi:dolichol-phosphate mannosyltransferase
MADETQLLCLVTPCYNEEEVIEKFYAEVKPVLQALAGLNHRLVFVDDGSRDRTLERLNALALRDPAVRVYALSRNFGHQIALTAGLDVARGDAVIMMDSDLQHPPGLIPEMVRLWREGNDIVSAVRQTTKKSGPFKRLSSAVFYSLINFLSDTHIVRGAADFCLLSRPAHRALRRLPERHRFLRGMVSWIGFKRAFVFFEAPDRAAGRSKYTLFKMLQLAFTATFSFSATPIRLATQLGVFTVLLSLLYLIFIMACYFLGSNLVPGWASIIFVVTFLGGVQLAFVGILGEYIARIFEEVKRRPLYVFKQKPPAE